MSTFLTNCLTNWSINLKIRLQNGISEGGGESPNADLMLFRHHFFQPGLLLRHHQEQMKLQQQQILSQWFQKEDQRESQEILLKDGTCQWPGCEKNQFASKATFQHHLNSEHSLSQCSAAQVLLIIYDLKNCNLTKLRFIFDSYESIAKYFLMSFQAKVQLQIVAQLEHSLLRERERFNAMMAHLNKVRFEFVKDC